MKNFKSKKVGQLTYSFGNYGSMLQCYATQKIFKENGYDIVLVNIADRGLERVYYAVKRRVKFFIKLIKNPNKIKFIYGLYNNAKQSTKYKTLSEESLNMMKSFKKEYISQVFLNHRKLKKCAKSSEYYFFISGSDQIWPGSWPILEEDYFLKFAPKHKRVAYAPSFGVNIIPSYNKKELIKNLQEYNCLSIREKTGEKIIKDLIGKSCDVLNDPVLQINKKYWDELIGLSESNNEKYICLFFIDKPTENGKKFIEKLCNITKLKCICFGYNSFEGTDKVMKSGGPIEFIKYIKNAELVITDSFHALLFSIIFEKNFYIISRNYQHSSSQSSRITDLLECCGLENRFIDINIEIDKNNIFSIDFIKSQEFIEKVQKKSQKYIQNIAREYSNGDL
ncbi:polysaccharide pyruvyl transferase family protein [Fusobacterium perfoetens]|uniref:polysaccharide pyruvyl transferase family protein n=1 Tax=Fusobacterium perfoetens TaxID=852 RepID=UPI001F227E9C|nr:polysaccharide pyruvyl transferase family protein [Fusobacterium perfoetens]MCF2612839.1 polysaccharide pyruvyl transferase family protein [Fusobacterium perfoetens]